MIVPNEQFWKVFKETPGAFSTAEAIALYNIVADIKYDGVGGWVEKYLELGSHRCKSSQAIAATLNKNAILYLVEPEFKDDEWRFVSLDRVLAANKEIDIECIADYSMTVLPNFDKLTFVFVDSGTHSDDLVMNEVKLLEDKIIKNEVISFHDYGSQFVKVNEAYDYLVRTGKYEPIKINWSEIFEYVKEHDLENGNNSWHKYPDLPHPPNFVGALKRVK